MQWFLAIIQSMVGKKKGQRTITDREIPSFMASYGVYLGEKRPEASRRGKQKWQKR